MPGLPSAAGLRKPAGQAVTGQSSDHLDLRIRVDRAGQRRAALMHASQTSPAAVTWRLQLHDG
jgi:hypothetical protein